MSGRSTTSEPQVPKTTTAVQQDDIVDLPDIQEEAATRDEEGPPMVDIPVPLADAVIQAVPEPIPNPVPLRRSTSGDTTDTTDFVMLINDAKVTSCPEIVDISA
eukprot:Em0055g25a